MGQPRLVHDALAAFVIDLPGLGQFDLAGGAVQKAQADGLFQPPRSAATGSVRHPKAVRGTASLHDLDEQRHVVQMNHADCSVGGAIFASKHYPTDAQRQR